MSRRAAAAASVVLLAAGVTGCSGGTDGYCAALRDHAEQLQESAAAPKPEAESVHATLVTFEQLQAEAPDNIADSWTTLVGAWRGLDDAVAEAGEEVGAAERSALRAASEELRSTEVRQAAVGIEQHALEVCEVDLGGSA